MIPHPLRLLLIGYGLASLLAAAMLAAGAGLLTTGLMVWLAGPAMVFALGMVPGIRKYFSVAVETPPDAELERARWVTDEEELRAWDADLAHDLEAQREPGETGRRTGSD